MITWTVDINRPTQIQIHPSQRLHLGDQHSKEFDYNKGDYEAIRQRLNGINWSEYLSGDTEERWQKFRNLIHQLQKAHIPLKSSKRTTKKALWLDNKAVRAVQKKRYSIPSIKIIVILL